jgi:hypothetical protein
LEASLVDLHKNALRTDLKKRLRYYFGKRNLDFALKQITQKETIMENFAGRTMEKLKLCTVVNPGRSKRKLSSAALGEGLKDK